MRRRIRRTISLPPAVSEELDRTAATNATSASAVVQHALRVAWAERRRRELARVRDHWSREATLRGVLTEDDLRRLEAVVDGPEPAETDPAGLAPASGRTR